MISLAKQGAQVSSVFDLLGDNENDLTAALGFTLARCPKLGAKFVQQIATSADLDCSGDIALALEVRGEVGRTDLEISFGDGLFIVEAKRGWLLPSSGQLEQYADRVMHRGRGALVTLSQASHALAGQSLPVEILGVPVIHVSWRDVLSMIDSIWNECRGREKFWLQELRGYLKGVVRVRSIADSWTYCVVLNDERPADGPSYKEFVTEHLNYFHPYGVGGWPTEPPNFVAFRWDGAVRRIHRVISADVVPHLQQRWPHLTTDRHPEADRPHAVYELGPRLPPEHAVPNDAQYRAARLWVLLDQLQTAPTLAEALARTKELDSPR